MKAWRSRVSFDITYVLGLAMILFKAKMKGFLTSFHKICETGQVLKFIVIKSGWNA